MRNVCWLLCLVGLGCQGSKESTGPDAAARVAGEYVLVYSYYSINGQTNEALPGSLTLVRMDAQTIKPTFRFRINGLQDGLNEKGNWRLSEVTRDSIRYYGPGYGGSIRNDQIDMTGYADGTLFFRFTRKP